MRVEWAFVIMTAALWLFAAFVFLFFLNIFIRYDRKVVRFDDDDEDCACLDEQWPMEWNKRMDSHYKCMKEREWGEIFTTLSFLKKTFEDHQKYAWLRVMVSGMVGGLMVSGGREIIYFIFKVIH